MRWLPAIVCFAGYSAAAEHAAVVVYGDSAAAVTAAIAAQRAGQSVVLIAPSLHVGGMSVEGLGSSDVNNHQFRNDMAIGGLARDFYLRLGAAYGVPAPVWLFESHVAEKVFNEMLAGVRVLRGRELAGVQFHKGTRKLRSVRLNDGGEWTADVFIDATIEGDLIAAAGVETVIGREANTKYGETKNGIRAVNEYRQFAVRVDPYQEPGNPKSGLLPTIQDEPLGTPGAGDHRVQGYCFRSCLTKDPANRLPFTQPPDYDGRLYEIYRRYARAGGKLFTPQARLPNGKTDLGSWHDLSANLYGMNHGYPAADAAGRRRIYEEHRRFVAGLFWFLANDPALPAELRAAWAPWGLCRDEFTDNGGWPRRLYVRDARRMVADHVITEHHTRRVNPLVDADPVAVAYWPPDTHHVRRIVKDGAAYNEGFVFGGDDWGPFGISYRAMTPRLTEAENLLTPTAVSSSHVAYGAIRLEWTFLALGEAAGTAAALAVERKTPVQRVDYAELRRRLVAQGQVVSLALTEAKTAPR